ncbi:E3 ubiquitin-protein ligase TRIM39-like [Dendrobates tinctorius]|uniref:E3 ubiquitin-protein ligase TRIM39-like n=1 Tax=Dendrobates tinctorius TaxID=92724 RepID=UPI003CC96200
MASAGLEKQLDCSICLSLYADPVTLSCGHNFCRDCIDQVLNTQDGSGVYSCPECREEFQERPTLRRNITLSNLLENLLSNHGDYALNLYTYCVDSTVPANESYLHSEASLCDGHLNIHTKGAEHILTDPTTSLENWTCSVHKQILEYYCTEDKACICVSCSLVGEHQEHKLESLDEAFRKREKLKNFLQKITTQRKKTEERVWILEEHKKMAHEKATKEAKRVSALFRDIRRRLDELQNRVLTDIYLREQQVTMPLFDMIQKLEIKKDELSRKMRHIEELCNMTDPLTVLQEPDTGDLCHPEEGGDDIWRHNGGGNDTGGHGGDRSVVMTSHISRTLYDMMIDLNVTFYVQDPADISLNVNTANNNLLISDDLKTVTWTERRQNRPETAERFQGYQVMSCSRLASGRHYWDVEISRSDLWMVGMCYSRIDRMGHHSYFGNNGHSWCLYRGLEYNNHYSVKHLGMVLPLPQQITTDRVRIYLDYEAGLLSFYTLFGPIKHLYTFTTVFTEPLHAALYVYGGSIKLLGGEEQQMKDLIHIERRSGVL